MPTHSVRTTLKHLHLWPYKISVPQELKPLDCAELLHYCQYLPCFVDAHGQVVCDHTFYTDEARFRLFRYIHSQNNLYWYADNPNVFSETLLHPQKMSAWRAISRKRIVGLIFLMELLIVRPIVIFWGSLFPHWMKMTMKFGFKKILFDFIPVEYQ